MNYSININYDFPIYSDIRQNIYNENDPYVKFIDYINFYKQLYMKTSNYKCDKNMIQFMIMLANYIYLYNDDELFESDILFDKSSGFSLSNYKFIFDSMPRFLSGFKKPGYNLEHKFLNDEDISKPIYNPEEDIKIVNKIDKPVQELLINIFKYFGAYSYQEILPYIKDMRIYKENCVTNQYIQNKDKNVFHRINLIQYINKDEVKSYFGDSDNFIEQFICNYDFSDIKAQNKLNSINNASKSKVKSYIDSVKN